ncbi:MAG: hypothetical protein GWN97_04945 [Thermoplasmata archaeon]|nr:hypothetical protein [Thermoplasmata archaeon]
MFWPGTASTRWGSTRRQKLRLHSVRSPMGRPPISSAASCWVEATHWWAMAVATTRTSNVTEVARARRGTRSGIFRPGTGSFTWGRPSWAVPPSPFPAFSLILDLMGQPSIKRCRWRA